jgi:aminopeptidase N
MAWWDDIWIIEGICVFMARKVLESMPKYKATAY